MSRESYDDGDIVDILNVTRSIALVGASPNPARYSHRVMHFMQSCDYRVLPVNPFAAGEQILGERVYADLSEIPGPFEMVNVFRRAEAIPEVADETIRLAPQKRIKFLWLQLDLYDEAVARKARAAGLVVVMDRCVKIEYGRLLAHRVS